MIYSVRGTLVHKEAGLAVIECGGVGYGCRTTYNTLARMGDIGSEETIYTYLHVREDGIELFGFHDRQELGCFKLLLGVSGVGPNMAQRIVLELKDKISKEQMSFAESSAPAAVNRVLISGGAAGEALDALLVLGYSQAEAESAVSKLDPALSAEELIRQALKSLAKF